MNDNTTSAAEQLRAIDAGSTAGIGIGRAGKVHDALYGTAVGVLIAGMLAVVVFVYPTHVPWLIGPSTVLYGVGIGVVLSVLGLALSIWFWVPYIVVTSLPMVIASNLAMPRDR